MTQIILALLASLSAPLLLIPIEKALPFPYFIEELVKLVIVGVIIKAENRTRRSFVVWVILAGVLFTISESIFYLINIFANGNLLLFPQRIFLTGTLHLSTMLTMYYLGKKKLYLLLTGYGMAVAMHWVFNTIVRNIN